MKSSSHTTKISLVFSAIIAVAMGARENHFNRPARSSEHIRYHRHIPFILQRHQLTDSQSISSPGYNPHYQREQQHHLTNRLLVEKKRRCQRVLDRTTNYSKVSTISRAKPSPRAGRQRYQLMLRRHGHRRYTIIPVSRNSYSGGRNQRRRNYIKTTISLPSRNYHGHYKSYSGLSRVSATEIRLTKPLTSIIPVSKTSTVTVPLGNPPSHQKRRNNVAITPTPRTAQLDRYSASPNGRRRIRVYLKGARGRHPYIFNNIASQSWSPCFRCPSDHLITVDRGRRCALASLPPLRSCSRLTSSPTSANIVVTVGPKPGTEVAEGEYFIQLHVEKFGVKLQTCQFRLKVKVQKCPPLKAPNNGYMMCTGGSRWGSVCKFACQRSYQLIGNYGVICEGDQHGVQWTGQLPMCRAQRCPSLRAPDHGYIMCSRGLLPPRSSCRFSCERNYQLVGCPVLFCDHRNIQWNRPPPECRAQRCPSIWAPDHGFISCTEGSSLGSTCKFVCTTNFRRVGISSTMCRKDNEGNIRWTSQPPVCLEIKRAFRVQHQCQRPVSPDHGLAYCDQHTTAGTYPVGTICRYFCDIGYEIPPELSKNAVIICRYSKWNITKSVICKKIQEGPLLCSRPNDPINGKTVCEKLRRDGKYPTGATCRYFCNPGYELSGSVSNTPVMVCRGPEWKVYKGVSCASTHCSEPTIPNNGHLECPTYSTGSPQSGISANNKLTYARGIICHYRCYRGYTIPSIQRNKTVIQCIGPYWNSTVYPQCKATPKPINCTDQALVAEGGVTEVKTPRFVAGDGTDLDVECVIQGELEPGEYNNTCKATDPDLGTTVECTYKIRVKGMACTSPPQIDHGSFNCIPGKFGELTPGSICNYHCDEGYVTPLSQSELITWICLSNVQWNITDKPTCLRIVPPKPVNCTDQILVAENGFAEVNKPRFIAANGKELDVECTLMKPLKLGNHSNICESTDSELQASARCTYGIQVIAPKCEQLPSVEYGFPSCVPGTFGEFTPGAVCTYKCENGFVIPASQSDIVARICLSSSRWNVTKFPECWKLDPPKPVNCINQTVVAKNGVVKVTKPRFVAGDGRELDVICSLEGLLEPGEHWNFCHAFDPELMTGDICIYNISVKVPTCDPPPQPEYGYVECNITESDEYPIGTTCYYSCLSDYVIPKSQSNLRTRVCLDLLQWNITSLPECKKKIVPYPKKGTCNDEIFETNDPSSITLDPPTFVRAQGDAAVVNCSLTIINSYGIHENLCRATDPELQTSTSCTYKIEVKDLEQSDSAIRLGCDPLSAPANGYIQCRAVQNTFWCNIKCKSGFSMPSNFHLLQEGYVKCDPLHGLWNFQRIYRIQRLPDCLAESPRTMIEGSIKFKTDVRDCSDYDNVSFLMDVIKKGLLGRNQEICGQIDCDGFIFLCSGGFSGVKPTLETKWMFQAIYEPGAVTQQENITTLIETVQFDTKAVIVSDPTFKKELLDFNAVLLEETFTDTHFRLVCQERGYVVNTTTNRCWECPTGTYEEEGHCKNCPGNHYQDRTGQTKCKSCPRGTISNSGSRSQAECKVTSISSDLDLPELVRDQPYVDKCKPNPCINYGICINSANDSYHCQCQHGYEGHLCQYRQLQRRYLCLNGGTLVMKRHYHLSSRCLCPPGYSGRRCGKVEGI